MLKSPPEAGPCKCGYAFSTLAAHRAHRDNERCLTPDELGYFLHKDGRYGPYGSPILGEVLPNEYEGEEEQRPKRHLNVVPEQRAIGEAPTTTPGPKPQPKRAPKPHDVRPTDTKRLECAKCGKIFAKRKGRGRPPKQCYECKGKA